MFGGSVFGTIREPPNQKILDLIQEAETGDNSRELATYNKILQLGLEDGIVVENRFYE